MHGTASAMAPPKADAVDANDLLIELAGQHGSVSALRAAILDRAVSGRLIAQGPVGVQQTAGAFPVPAHWHWARGTEIFSFVTSGSRGWAQYYAEKGPIFLRIGNLDYESIELDLKEIQRVQPPVGAEGTRTKVEAGDVLVSITGDTGMVGLVREGLGDAYINQHIALARPVSTALPEYIARALTAPTILGAVQRAQRGIKNSLGLEDIRKIALPLPPLAEQKRIVAKVDQLMALCDELEAKQAKMRDVGDRVTKAALGALTSAETPEEFKVAWHRVADNFTSLFDGPAVIAGLREALLDLAMKGLLVPQDIGDGTAEAIVDALPSKRAALAKKLAFRQGDAQATGVPKDEQPHAVPPSWRWVRLNAFGCFMGGGTPSKANPDFWKGSIPWVSPKDMKRPFIADAEDHISRAALESSAAKLIPSPSLLVVLRGMILAHSFPVALTERDVAVNQDMRALVFADPSLAPFVLRACQAARARVLARVERSSHGTCRLDSEVAESLPIPLPPVAEQKRIIARLEQLTALCNDLEARLLARDTCAGRLAESLVRASATDAAL
ncbi:MAG: restriction endonuclease subunit S [Myxococcaceae bacterium]|jgi:type I restriction enzyme S subunit|nr:restriction endonuclease subunit S [Myxococcaceae bacterium]